MTAAARELQKAVLARLTADAPLTALIGEGKIYDVAPAHAAFPYVTFGRTSLFDWSSASEAGAEHIFTLNVWSKRLGRGEALAIMERLRALVDDAPLEMAGHRLVLMRLDQAETRHDDTLALHQGVMRFRALTEAGA
jgi:hypothetical protein